MSQLFLKLDIETLTYHKLLMPRTKRIYILKVKVTEFFVFSFLFLKKKTYSLCFYLNNRVFLSRHYLLIVAQRKYDGLKTNICPRNEASRANMPVLRTSNFQGTTIRPSSETWTLYCLYCSPLNFLPHALARNSIELFIRCKEWKPDVKFEN